MDSERWTRLERLFEEARAVEPAERTPFLERRCGDPALRAEVMALLEAAAQGERMAERVRVDAARILADTLERGLVPDASGGAGHHDPDDVLEQASRRIGPFRVISRIGAGGMGAVYLADRADGAFEQRVAIKLIKRGMDTEEILRRFRSERQILARLQHPSVARLLDGGMTDDGLPWFAMEHVEGEPIDRWCARGDPPRGARLRLFLAVCDAVRYAHRNLVVHRDLKPDNILIRADGTVALLDFGIARLLEKDDDGTRTRGGAVPLTPSYAAPEQVEGGPVTTATDVFALGVVLHEMLTGERPARRGHERALSLGGDLAAVCAKALEPEPERRYGSVDELANDIERFLAGLPVRARPAGTAYRARRFLARHRVGVAAIVALLLGLSALTGFYMDRLRTERDRARAESEKAQQVTSLLLDVFRQSDPDQSRGQAVTARELLDRGAERAERELADRPELRAQTSAVIGSVYRSLGLFDDALPLLERSLSLRTELFGSEDASVAESTLELAWLLHDRGDYDHAEALARRALELETSLGRDSAAAAARHAVASQRAREGDYAGAEALHRENLAARRELFGGRHAEVAQTLNGLGGVLLAQGQHEEAAASYRATLDVNRALYGEMHREVATALANLGATQRLMGQPAASEASTRAALDIRIRVLGPEHPHTTSSLNTLGVGLMDQGRLDDAEPYLREALRIRRERLGPRHPQTAVPLFALATLLRRRGDLEAAEPLFRESLELHRETLEPGHANIAHALLGMASILGSLDRNAEAEPYLREAVTNREASLGPQHWLTYVARSELGANRSALGRVAEADRLLADAHRGLLDEFGAADRRTRLALGRLVDHYEGTGRAERAETLRREAEGQP